MQHNCKNIFGHVSFILLYLFYQSQNKNFAMTITKELTETPYSIGTLKEELYNQMNNVNFWLEHIRTNPNMLINYKIEIEKSIEISKGYIKDIKMAIETLS